MHLLKKILPLSLLIVTSITYANDDEEPKQIKP